MSSEANVWFNNNGGNNKGCERSTEQIIRQIEPYFNVIDVNSDDKLLLGASYLGGILWNGSMWLFSKPELAPKAEDSITCIDMDVGASAGKFYDDTHVVVADYSGAVSLLFAGSSAEDRPIFFTHLGSYRGHDRYMNALDCSSTAKSLYGGGIDSCIIVWDIDTYAKKAHYPVTSRNGISGLSIKPDSESFVTTSHEGLCLLWDIRAERPASPIISNDISLSCVDWLDANYVVVGDLAGSLRVIDIRNLSASSHLNLSSGYPVKKVAVNREKKLIATSVDKPIVQVMTCEDGILNSVYSSSDHTGLVRGLSWSKVTGLLHSCGWDTQVIHHTIPVS